MSPDVNDNPPQFQSGSLEVFKSIPEREAIHTLLGTICAFDINGPGNNNVTFTMRSIDNLIADGMISINNLSGVLSVSYNIQYYIPKIYTLNYNIILKDGQHMTSGK
ncbi:PREDICTED: cadherin-18-like, partial [Bactrocera latifrons]|uniref:cadherin-18-like n=1 Tax=Bactrocera latifrons TaxID=174628 RepID=UPI0008DDD2EF